jgi:hypothetical protein
MGTAEGWTVLYSLGTVQHTPPCDLRTSLARQSLLCLASLAKPRFILKICSYWHHCSKCTVCKNSQNLRWFCELAETPHTMLLPGWRRSPMRKLAFSAVAAGPRAHKLRAHLCLEQRGLLPELSWRGPLQITIGMCLITCYSPCHKAHVAQLPSQACCSFCACIAVSRG